MRYDWCCVKGLRLLLEILRLSGRDMVEFYGSIKLKYFNNRIELDREEQVGKRGFNGNGKVD